MQLGKKFTACVPSYVLGAKLLHCYTQCIKLENWLTFLKTFPKLSLISKSHLSCSTRMQTNFLWKPTFLQNPTFESGLHAKSDFPSTPKDFLKVNFKKLVCKEFFSSYITQFTTGRTKTPSKVKKCKYFMATKKSHGIVSLRSDKKELELRTKIQVTTYRKQS